MGAALLTNPDLLCSILTALRKALPADVPISAKIRLLPGQNDTLALVKRIVETGISALTIHCRTRDMRPRESALVERLKEIVTFVEVLGLGVTVIENGDCTGRPDFERIKTLTGAHSVMVATAAESNLSCFASAPVVDAETVLAPEYARLVCRF
jgi:tRNA-dihydrouridine synthase 2